MNQHADLLPCPFCGGVAAIQEHEAHTHSGPLKAIGIPDHPGSFTIECIGPGCNTGQIADTRDEVVAMWNRRAAGQNRLDAEAAARYGYIRTISPRKFTDLWEMNIAGKGQFDELVDAARRGGSGDCSVCAGTGTAFGKTCNCKKGASHG